MINSIRLLKIATGTKEAWEATTSIIPEGVLCYETDTHNSKVGDGESLYSELGNVFDAIPEAIRTLIDSGTLVYTVDGIIPTSFFSKDIFNIHTVVQTIADRDALNIEIIRNSILVLVIDASADETVDDGMAMYVAKFTDDSTYTWIKTGEGESLDLDLSQFLFRDTVTLDDIADSDTYTRFMQSDLDDLTARLQPTDIYTVELNDHTYWTYNLINDPDLLFYISGYNPNGIIEEKNSAILTLTGSPVQTTDIMRNGHGCIHSTGSAYIQSTDTTALAPLKIGTGNFFISYWDYVVQMDSGYAEQVFVFKDSTNAFGLRFGNSGYSNKLQGPVGNVSGTTISNYYATEMTKSSVTLNVWHHYAICRADGYVHVFYDGMRILSKAEYNNTTFDVNTVSSVRIGRGTGGTFNHYYQDVRVYKKALYTEAFDPSELDVI